tara:strand:- start:2525 stop:3901 length:1377 start_codon:yes stop_codon:yes gene_type:complete
MNPRQALKRVLKPLAEWMAPEAKQVPMAHWNLSRSGDGSLTLGDVSLVHLAHEFGTPVHVLSDERLRANLDALGPVELFCSYKTHPVPHVLKTMHETGAGAEVISELELDMALKLGLPPERIIYNGTAKTERLLRTAIGAGILLLNINHLEELDVIAAIARDLKARPRVGVRVNTRSGWSAQFGSAIDSGAALRVFEKALGMSELEVVGLHSHRGALIRSVDALEQYVAELLGFCDELFDQFGWSPEIFDVGGSLPVASVSPYSSRDIRFSQTFGIEVGGPDPSQNLRLDAYAKQLRHQVEAHFSGASRPVPRLVAEPGRAVTGDAQLMLTRVISVREVDEGLPIAVLDVGVNAASIMKSERHQIFHVNKTEQGAALQKYRVVGPVCQPGDVMSNAVSLPHLERGDVLAIMDSGAYFEPDATVFSFVRPGTVMLRNGRAQMVRRHETLDDVLARDLVL